MGDETPVQAPKSNILKKFQEIMEFLNKPENLTKKVSEVIDQVTQLASAKTRSTPYGETFLRDTNDKVVAVLCSFFKRWMPLEGTPVDGETVKFGDAGAAVDFGDKTGTNTGLNDMCKVGQNAKRQRKRDFDIANKALVDSLLDESVDGPTGRKQLDKLEAGLVKPGVTTAGFVTREEVIEYLTKEQGVKVKMPV